MIENLFADLGLSVLERGWLSSNNIVFAGAGKAASTVVDTGYDSHKHQTAALIQGCLGQQPLRRILNTHLHSDHCGGNSFLQEGSQVEVLVPQASHEAARTWNQSELSFDATDQRCDRFEVTGALRIGDQVILGKHAWRVLSAPGHDHDAIMLFEPRSRVLISGDALWESRLAIVFPELTGGSGFKEVRQVLDTIEALEPSVVIPGHGRPFDKVPKAIRSSRERLAQFELAPERHTRHATRALLMFHMLEHRDRRREDLLSWLTRTPIFRDAARALGNKCSLSAGQVAEELVDAMVADQLLVNIEGSIRLPD